MKPSRISIASFRKTTQLSMKRDIYMYKEIEKIIKNSDGELDIYFLFTDISKKVEVKIIPTLIKLPNFEPIYLTTIKGIVKIIRSK